MGSVYATDRWRFDLHPGDVVRVCGKGEIQGVLRLDEWDRTAIVTEVDEDGERISLHSVDRNGECRVGELSLNPEEGNIREGLLKIICLGKRDAVKKTVGFHTDVLIPGEVIRVDGEVGIVKEASRSKCSYLAYESGTPRHKGVVIKQVFADSDRQVKLVEEWLAW